MNNKGFAITGILYTILMIFVVSIVMLLFNLQNRKTILDELKADTVDAVESENNYEYLLNEINTLKAQIGTTDISGVGDGTITGAIYPNSNAAVYSEQEIAIGKWVDGSTVYRKTVAIQMPESDGRNIELYDATNLNVKIMIKMYGYIYFDNNFVQYPISISDTATAEIEPYYNNSTGKVNITFINNSGKYSNADGYLILEYTKNE